MQATAPSTAGYVSWARLGIALVQGLMLVALYQANEHKSWPATNGLVFAPLLAVSIFVPVLLVSSLGNLRLRAAVAWCAIAAIACAALAYYDIARDPEGLSWSSQTPRTVPSTDMWFVVSAILFIVHTMVVAGSTDRRPIATYPTQFDVAWKHGIQFGLSVCFIAVLWGLLLLGAELFKLIRIEFFGKLIDQPTFFIPVTAMAFGCALHITDVRAGIVQGTRTLLLILQSWLLPLMALIVAGFIVALPFTGLEPLWETRHATSILLISAAALIVLINAAHEDGRTQNRTAVILRFAKVVAAGALLPLVGLAAYAVSLRVGQYGWTPERIAASACVTVAAVYALGYAFALRTGFNMTALEHTNVGAALLIALTLLALYSPVLDPARISAADQVRRLVTGRVSPGKLDFEFLRFRAGRFGKQALEQLAAQSDGPQAARIAERASQALRATHPYQARLAAEHATPALRARNITVVQPPGGVMPESFLRKDWKAAGQPVVHTRCLIANVACNAILADLDSDGHAEVLIVPKAASEAVKVFKQNPDGDWDYVGDLSHTSCPGAHDALTAGRFQTEPSPFKDLVIDGDRLQVSKACRPRATPPQKPATPDARP